MLTPGASPGYPALFIPRSFVTRSLVRRAAVLASPQGGAGGAPDSGTAFRVTKHPTYLFAGLVPLARPNLEDVLAGQLGTGARIANLRIKVRSRWSDLLVTALTLGIVVPRSVTFEGVVVSK